MSYTISFSNGATNETFDSYEDAIDRVDALYPDGVIGHDGDLKSLGDRTLCWATVDDAIDDDGARAACSIVRVK